MSTIPNKVIYSMVGVSRYFDKKAVLKDIYLSYFYGAKIGVIGLNGSGKSTLLRILAGVDQDFQGKTAVSPGFTIGFLEQEPQLDPAKTVREIVEEGVQPIVALLREFDEINAKFAEPMSDKEMSDLLEKQGKVQERLDAAQAWDLDSRLEMAMDALRCPPPETSVSILSGGEKRRVGLCRLLLQKPDILLLDEPTNHLDAESVAWLEHHIQQYEGTVIAVTQDLEIYIPPGPRLGQVVIEALGLKKAYGDRLLFEDLNFRLPPGGIVGVIGPNGAGKTTLFRLITGQEKPDTGSIRLGDTVKLAYVDQSRDLLDPEKTAWQEISDGFDTVKLGSREVNSRAYVARFNFSGSDQQKKVGNLSGGERNRVHLAKTLKQGANVLLLDEPTNDLDVNTLRALEEALENFAGCAVIISHDRWFLDRVATHILAFEGDSQVVWFEGNYSDYEADRRSRLGTAAGQPHRIKYRHLTR